MTDTLATITTTAKRPPPSLKQCEIDVTITLASGGFGNSGNTVKLSGLRVKVHITKAILDLGQAQIDVYGMPLDIMQQCATLGQFASTLTRNTVLIEAGNVGGVMAIVFTGTIWNGWADFAGAPDSVFHISAWAGLADLAAPVGANSSDGPLDVATMMQALASAMSLKFENNGVNVKLANQVLPGSAIDQYHKLAQAANINAIIDNGTLEIWPIGSARGGTVPLVSVQSGMIGYPTFVQFGVLFSTLFRPDIDVGQNVEVKSSLQSASGTWNVISLVYEMESQSPQGLWQITAQAINWGNNAVATS